MNENESLIREEKKIVQDDGEYKKPAGHNALDSQQSEHLPKSERPPQFPETIEVEGVIYTYLDRAGQGVITSACLYQDEKGDGVIVKAPNIENVKHLPDIQTLHELVEIMDEWTDSLEMPHLRDKPLPSSQAYMMSDEVLTENIRYTLREAKILADLNKAESQSEAKCIVTSHGLRFHNGWPLLVMEFVPSYYKPSNFIDFDRLKTKEGYLDENIKILDAMVEVTRAVMTAHKTGYTLRDFEPETKHDRFRCYASLDEKTGKQRLEAMRVIDWNGTDSLSPEMLKQDLTYLGLHLFHLATGRYITLQQYLHANIPEDEPTWNSMLLGTRLLIDNLIRGNYDFTPDLSGRGSQKLEEVASLVLSTLQKLRASARTTQSQGYLNYSVINEYHTHHNLILGVGVADLVFQFPSEDELKRNPDLRAGITARKKQLIAELEKGYWLKLSDIRVKVLMGLTGDQLVADLDALIREFPPTTNVLKTAKLIRAQVLTYRKLNTKAHPDLKERVDAVVKLVTAELYEEAEDKLNEPEFAPLLGTALHQLVRDNMTSKPDFIPGAEARRLLAERTQQLSAAEKEIEKLRDAIANLQANTTVTPEALELATPPIEASQDLRQYEPQPTPEAGSASERHFDLAELYHMGAEELLQLATQHPADIYRSIAQALTILEEDGDDIDDLFDGLSDLLETLLGRDKQTIIHTWLRGTESQQRAAQCVILACDELIERATDVVLKRDSTQVQRFLGLSVAVSTLSLTHPTLKQALQGARSQRAGNVIPSTNPEVSRQDQVNPGEVTTDQITLMEQMVKALRTEKQQQGDTIAQLRQEYEDLQAEKAELLRQVEALQLQNQPSPPESVETPLHDTLSTDPLLRYIANKLGEHSSSTTQQLNDAVANGQTAQPTPDYDDRKDPKLSLAKTITIPEVPPIEDTQPYTYSTRNREPVELVGQHLHIQTPDGERVMSVLKGIGEGAAAHVYLVAIDGQLKVLKTPNFRGESSQTEILEREESLGPTEQKACDFIAGLDLSGAQPFTDVLTQIRVELNKPSHGINYPQIIAMVTESITLQGMRSKHPELSNLLPETELCFTTDGLPFVLQEYIDTIQYEQLDHIKRPEELAREKHWLLLETQLQITQVLQQVASIIAACHTEGVYLADFHPTGGKADRVRVKLGQTDGGSAISPPELKILDWNATRTEPEMGIQDLHYFAGHLAQAFADIRFPKDSLPPSPDDMEGFFGHGWQSLPKFVQQIITSIAADQLTAQELAESLSRVISIQQICERGDTKALSLTTSSLVRNISSSVSLVGLSAVLDFADPNWDSVKIAGPRLSSAVDSQHWRLISEVTQSLDSGQYEQGLINAPRVMDAIPKSKTSMRHYLALNQLFYAQIIKINQKLQTVTSSTKIKLNVRKVAELTLGDDFNNTAANKNSFERWMQVVEDTLNSLILDALADQPTSADLVTPQITQAIDKLRAFQRHEEDAQALTTQLPPLPYSRNIQDLELALQARAYDLRAFLSLDSSEQMRVIDDAQLSPDLLRTVQELRQIQLDTDLQQTLLSHHEAVKRVQKAGFQIYDFREPDSVLSKLAGLFEWQYTAKDEVTVSTDLLAEVSRLLATGKPEDVAQAQEILKQIGQSE